MSASEIALFSLSKFQLRSMKEHLRTAHRKIKKLLADPGGLLVTILVINEIVNISLSAVIAESVANTAASEYLASFLPRWIPNWAVDSFIGLIITAPIILFFCEVTPKVLAAHANQLIAPLAAGPLTILYSLLMPIRVALERVIRLLTSRISKPQLTEKPKRGTILKESDFILMAEEGRKEGAIEENEFELIKNVFELDNTTVADVYTPIGQVKTITSDTLIKTALLSFRGAQYSRVPVSTPDRKKLIGILYSKDLLKAKLDPELLSMPIESIMRRPLFVSPSLRLNSLFRKLKMQKTHLAVVQDPSGSFMGVVTMSDLLDTLFEDIFPEDINDDIKSDARSKHI